jgi:hypothetical protein
VTSKSHRTGQHCKAFRAAGHAYEHNWDCPGFALQRRRHRYGMCKDDIGLQRDQFFR